MNTHLRTIRAIALLAVVALAAALFGGCKKAASVEGKWTSSGGVTLTFNADKTFSQGGPMAMTGTWSETGNKVSAKISKMGGMSMDALANQAATGAGHPELAGSVAQMMSPEFELSEDGKTLSQKAGNASIATYTKDESK